MRLFAVRMIDPSLLNGIMDQGGYFHILAKNELDVANRVSRYLHSIDPQFLKKAIKNQDRIEIVPSDHDLQVPGFITYDHKRRIRVPFKEVKNHADQRSEDSPG